MEQAQAQQQEIENLFSDMKNWEERYKKLIAMGKDLAKIPEEYYQEKYLVKGCQSQVWLHAGLDEQGKMVFYADSDALIVKGLASLLLKAYSGLTPAEVIATPPSFIEKLGFQSHLSPSRANGFLSMVKQIKFYALALQAQSSP